MEGGGDGGGGGTAETSPSFKCFILALSRSLTRCFSSNVYLPTRCLPQTRPEQTSAGPFFSRPGQSTASEIAAHPTLISILPLELDSP